MEQKYLKNFYIDRASDIAARAQFDDNGFAKAELLPGIYKDGITSYKCFLKAGHRISPELFSDKSVIIFFGKGQGELIDCDGKHQITEVAFYVPYMEKEEYEIHAIEDMEFVLNIVEMNQSDMAAFNRWHIRLPYFRLHSECIQYIQDCKGPNTEARMILCPKWMGRVILGTTRAIGEGTVEAGHPKVHQWNYCVGASDFHMSVGYKAKNNMETVSQQAGDWSFIPAGADHDLVADPDKEVYYIWFEHYADEKAMDKM